MNARESAPVGKSARAERRGARRIGPQEAAADACAAIAAYLVCERPDDDDFATLKAAQAILGRAMDA